MKCIDRAPRNRKYHESNLSKVRDFDGGDYEIFRMILCTLKMEAKRSAETSVPTRPTRCHIQEDGFLQK
jgi:hypothetical protein